MSEYFTMTVEVSKEEVMDFLVNEGYTLEELESMDARNVLSDEAVEMVNAYLSNYISDYSVYDKNSIVLGFDNE